MAYHRKHRHHRHRRNPLGISGGLVKEAAFVAAGAVASAALPGMIAPSFAGGWMGVLSSGLASVGASFVGRMIGGPAAGADVLKGGLAITVLKGLNQAGIKTPGLGLYAPGWFAVPTASDQYLRTAPGNVRGVPMLVAPAKGSHLGYHRFRSRYAGGYG